MLNQILEINIELKKGIRGNSKIVKSIVEEVLNELIESNSEFKYLYGIEGKEKLIPNIIPWPYQHPKYFKPVGKQKWVKK